MDDGQVLACGSPDAVFNNPDHPRMKTFFQKIIR
jgi:ABC-type polar amino acid transport system ATPase subunit